MRLFSEDKAKARKLYQAYMDDGLAVDNADIYATIDQRVLGDESFLSRMMQSSEVESTAEEGRDTAVCLR